MEKINTYVVDACGLITFLRNENGAEKLLDLFTDNKNVFLMHAINLGEVYYDLLRSNKDNAEKLFSIISDLQISVIWEVDKDLIRKAGLYKVNFKMSYADSFVLSTAEKKSGVIITTDHHEFDNVEKNTNLKFFWLR